MIRQFAEKSQSFDVLEEKKKTYAQTKEVFQEKYKTY